MGKNVLTSLNRRPLGSEAVLFPRGSVPLHAMLTGAGREVQHAPGYDWHGLHRGRADFALLQHTFAGRGRLVYEDREHFVEAGRTMLLFFPHDNRYHAIEGEAWDFFWVGMTGLEVMRLWRQAIDRLGPVVELSEATLHHAAAACHAVLHRELRGPGHASALAYGLAATLTDDAYPPTERHRRRPAEIQRAIDHLREHLDRSVPVEELADVAGYSKWHFSRRFAESEGVPPSEFITRQRMKAAAALLQSSGDPVKTIAYRCGYEDPNYFAKVFRRCFHVSPSDFRESRMFRGA